MERIRTDWNIFERIRMKNVIKNRKRRSQLTCGPEDAHIHSNGGWCPRKSNGKQNIQFFSQ
jgi:hypothetical protein